MPMPKKEGLILINGFSSKRGINHLTQRLKEEFSDLGVSIAVRTSGEILAAINNEGDLCTPSDLNPDFIVYLDKDCYLSSLLEDAGYSLFNDAEAIEVCDDKMKTYAYLLGQGIAMPATIPAPLNYGDSIRYDFLEEVAEILGFPMVVKTNHGSMGQGVFLIHGMDELIQKEEELKNIAHLYQQFISSSLGMDYRLILIGGKFITGMKRVNELDFRSNLAEGGHGEKVEIPPQYIEFAEKIANIIKLDYCGIDLLVGPHGEPILCEVNSNAFIEGIEKVTGFNVAKAYAEYIYNRIYLNK